MLTSNVNRYSVVFKARLNCKTFYVTATHSEEAMLLLDHHIKVMLSVFSSCVTMELSMAVGHMSAMVKRASMWQRVLKDCSAYREIRSARSPFISNFPQTGIMRALSHQGIQMWDLTQDMGFKS